MPANKKKKKIVANPARGVATVSIPSKLKLDVADSTDVSETTSTVTAPTSVASDDYLRSQHVAADANKTFEHLSPEEVVQQLEEGELRAFVANIQPRIQKDCARQVSRARTDRRLLRAQAERLVTGTWLPRDFVSRTLDMIRNDLGDTNYSGVTFPAGSLQEEDITAKIWALRRTLEGLGFSDEHIDSAMQFIIRNPPQAADGTRTWGFEESLEWLALDSEQAETYDGDNSRAPIPDPPLSARDSPQLLPQRASPPPDEVGLSNTMGNDESRILNHTTTGVASAPSDCAPVSGEMRPKASADEFSDDDSALEPENMLPKYLQIKTRLYELDPTLTDIRIRDRKKHKVPSTGSDSKVSSSTHKVRKLQQDLKRMENDVLFDTREAEAHWIELRDEVAKENAIRKKLDITTPKETVSDGCTNKVGVVEVAELPSDVLSRLEGGGALEGLFEMPEGGHRSSQTSLLPGSGEVGVRIQDYGKFVGLSPRRVLEEVCRARDSGVKLTYSIVSNTTYAYRHSIHISWSKDQDLVVSHVPDVLSIPKTRSHIVTTTSIATPDAVQSEAYIATAALFVLFSSSPGEERSHMRLPAVWRELWSDFVELKKERDESDDRNTVRDIRALIREQHDQTEARSAHVTSGVQKTKEEDQESFRDTQFGKDSLHCLDAPELQALWSRKAASSTYRRMLTSRTKLPMYQAKEDTLSAIESNQVTIICGETGCGKSTQVPSFILERELSSGRACKIYVTEPRRISAISLARRVSEELGEPKNDLGTARSMVGYAIRLESRISLEMRLVFATVGILLRMLESSDALEGITHLIIDEVHERSIETDFLLVVLRSLIRRRQDLKVILMSATVDAQRFSTYLYGAPVLTVPGRTFPVHVKFLEDAIQMTHHTVAKDEHWEGANTDADVDDADAQQPGGQIRAKQFEEYSASTRNTLAVYDEYKIDYPLIVKIIEQVAREEKYSSYSKAVLVFLPGIAEIRRLNEILTAHPLFSRKWLIYTLHSTIGSEDQQTAFQLPPHGWRKIVLATNIAETGITIPDITCVVDTGKHKEMRFDERRQLSRLTQSFISRANAKQRRGRAGRVQEGLCFYLFTRVRHDEMMSEQQTPEMLRLSLQDLVMRVKICKLGNIEQTLRDALDPPSPKNIRRAIDGLIEVGALNTNEELTPLGEQLAKLPLDAYLGKLILMGSIFSCLDVSLTIAALLSSKSPFVTPIGNRASADAARLAYRKGDSDLLTAYNAYCAWRRVGSSPGSSEEQFCRKNYLSAQNLANIEDLKGQLLSSLAEAGFVVLGKEERAALSSVRYGRGRHPVLVPPPSNQNNESQVLVTSVIALSFYPKILVRDGKGWRSVSNNAPVSLSPASVNKSFPPNSKYLSYYNIMQSGGRFTNAHETSPVPVAALALLLGTATFHMYAGVMVIDGNRFRFSVAEWKTLLAIKAIRENLAEVIKRALKTPSKTLSEKGQRWLQLWMEIMKYASEKLEEQKQIRR